jgi:hypothetical protein
VLPLSARWGSAAAVAAALTAANPPRPGGQAPWPGGRAPSATDLQAAVDEALRLARRERAEDLARARAPQEASESATLPQAVVDERADSLDVVFLQGDSFFSHPVEPVAGLGGLIPPDRVARVHRGAAGGIDTFSCLGCHAVGGLDGSGTFGQSARLMGDGARLSTTVTRNPPALPGVGLLVALAEEMTADLHAVRDRALAEAPRTLHLVSKGVDFGTISTTAEGRVDLSGVVGVDPDLVVRPLGWKGEAASLRRMIEEASRVHFGVQTVMLEEAYRRAPDPERLGPGPDWWDPDADGVLRELEEGAVTVTAAYLAMLEVPVIVPPGDPALTARFSRGSAAMASLGCESCHTRALQLEQRFHVERPETTDGPGFRINLLVDGDAPKGTDQVALFSDLKRHAMGEALADPHDGRLPRDVFLTRPLWGVADSGPWLHDGRAATLREAIQAHGGEAAASQQAFADADAATQADLLVFLSSLSRQPRLRVAR